MSNTYLYEMAKAEKAEMAKAKAKVMPKRITKIEAVMKLYESVFPDSKCEQKGSWIHVDENGDINSYRSEELLTQIYFKTGNMYEWDSELKSLHMVAAHADTLWDTGSKRKPIHVTKPASAKEILETYEKYEESQYEENLFDDIGEI
jgi:hypothetical protein